MPLPGLAEVGSPARSLAFAPLRPHSPVAEHLAEAAWPRTASTAKGGRSHPHRPWLSPTSSFPRLSELGEAATAGDPCWPRPHIRREPALAEDVAPWRGPTIEWYKSREKQMGLRRPCGSRRG